MLTRTSGTASCGMAAAMVIGFGAFAQVGGDEPPPAAPPVTIPAGVPTPEPVPEHFCGVDLSLPGQIRDIVSNALGQGFNRPGAEVEAFLDGAQTRYATGPELLTAAAARFGITEAGLWAEVERYKHINCGVMPLVNGDDAAIDEDRGRYEAVEASEAAWTFARDVTLHVVLHEIGHGLIREFDLPVLANEETTADAFATHYLTTHMPDRAVDAIRARVTSLMIEAGDEPVDDWKGEHDHDGRRAFQIAALAVAADPVKYAPVAAVVGMSEEDIEEAVDYGAEIHRDWRRALEPLWMPAGAASTEAAVEYDDQGVFVKRVCEGALATEVERALRRFDWHSTVTVRFVDDSGGAGWSRGSRTVTVNSEYLNRFVEQGGKAVVEVGVR